MLRILVATFLLLAPAASFAQAPQGGMYPQVGATLPIVVNQAPPVAGGGVINIGQAFGTVLQPYIDALAQAAIVGAIGWLGWILKNKFSVELDERQRAALQDFLQNSASSLIAAGAVHMNGKTITVRSEALAAEANSAITRIPDALAHFGLDAPSAAKLLEDKIMDAIPQTAAGAAIAVQAHAGNSAPQDAPIVSADRPATPMPTAKPVTASPPAA